MSRTVTHHLLDAVKAKEEPCILVDARSEKIVSYNSAWRSLCGFGAEALGKSPKILHGEKTDRTKAATFAAKLKSEGKANAILVNYSKEGREFCHQLRARRVFSDTTSPSR